MTPDLLSPDLLSEVAEATWPPAATAVSMQAARSVRDADACRVQQVCQRLAG